MHFKRALVASLAWSALAPCPAAPAPLAGFGSSSAETQRRLEARFDAAIDPGEIRSWLEQMSSEPNQVGSPHDRANAEFMLGKFREWGWDARLEAFQVLYPTPKHVALELLGASPYTARLEEPALAGDATSSRQAGGLPPYNIYSADGDVTAELVYVNFGMPADYVQLARRGIDVRGRIVIARYGAGWRGLKVKLAQEHGALGCIIYSDPHEDGYGTGDSYPVGPARPEFGVQRGSVQDITQYTGDPLTPGVGATESAVRLPRAEAKTLPRIPALPISYGDASALLAALGGRQAPKDWHGSLPFDYHIGPGPARVHLVVQSNWEQKTIYDVVARIAGRDEPEQWVIRGNHHDGWVFGAWDPLAGNVALMAEAKAIGALVRSGWQPRRTLLYASWDGEEPGLLGSTEWAETHAEELRRSAVLYVNSDTNSRGLLSLEGSPSYEHLVNEAAGAVADPETGASVIDRLRAAIRVRALDGVSGAGGEEALHAAEHGADLPLGALGSGSDYTPFLQHLGIASLDLGFEGEGQDSGIYHSAYDSFDHFRRFGDPAFAYETTLAKTAGRIVLREADADLLPVRFGGLAGAVSRYVSEVERLGDDERERGATLRHLADSGAFGLASDPSDPLLPPPVPAPAPKLDFSSLKAAAAKLTASAAGFDEAYAAAAARNFSLPTARRNRANDLIGQVERSLTFQGGLPSRPWYIHALSAPGLNTGYAAKTLPWIREAIEEHHWTDAQAGIAATARVLGAAAARIDEAAGVLHPLAPAQAFPAPKHPPSDS